MCCPRFCARLRPSAVRVRIRSRSTSANLTQYCQHQAPGAGAGVGPRLDSDGIAPQRPGDDLLAGELTRVGNVRNNDASLIEPIAA
jgi:hypothetical protein